MKSVIEKAIPKKAVATAARAGKPKSTRSRAKSEEPNNGSHPAPIHYDLEDIEEANRIGAALVRQHAL